MNDSRYRQMLYVILIVILSTIGIQVYWNYKNYLSNKQQLINEVQVSLDNAVDTYYTHLAQNSAFSFAFKMNSENNSFNEKSEFDSILKFIDSSHASNNLKKSDSVEIENISGVSFNTGIASDSVSKNFHFVYKNINSGTLKSNSNWLLEKEMDSVGEKKIKMLTSKVLISIADDSLSLKKIDTLLRTELFRKHLNIDYNLSYNFYSHKTLNFGENAKNGPLLNTNSKSPFLPKNSELTIHFSNPTFTILKRILTGILISTLLVLAVIGCLFYLIKIIKHQKQLAEVKNDLISNITHEFKTPIATIGVALESIKSFNVIDDKAKTKTYLDMSSEQLSKLNIMVEKLLETATLDSDNLELIKEKYNISDILFSVIEKHKMQTETKTIRFKTSTEPIIGNIDVFHFENAINNIIDNAIKYGGDKISVTLEQDALSFTVIISDNGNTLTKINKDKIFEKFYRVPKGNTHDVKGFGIGLYYAKKIIEKHGGTIHLDLNDKQTTFKISLPNE